MKTKRERLGDLRMKIAKLVSNVLEERIEELISLDGFEPADNWELRDIREDLVNLNAWTTRSLAAIDNLLGNREKYELIEKMRNISGRPPPEGQAFLQKAAQMERELVREHPNVIQHEVPVRHKEKIPYEGSFLHIGFSGTQTPDQHPEEPDYLFTCLGFCGKTLPLIRKNFEINLARGKYYWRHQCKKCHRGLDQSVHQQPAGDSFPSPR